MGGLFHQTGQMGFGFMNIDRPHDAVFYATLITDMAHKFAAQCFEDRQIREENTLVMKKNAPWMIALLAFGLAIASGAQAIADTRKGIVAKGGEPITISGVHNILIRQKDAKGSVILLTGGDGRLGIGPDGAFGYGDDNVLIRNRDAFAKDFNVLLVDAGTSLAAAVKTMAALKRPVTVVATSAGTQRAAQGLVQGARPDRLVLTSGFLSRGSGPSENIMDIMPYPELLPPTLVIHHRQDECRFTKPAGVDPFLAWAAGRARVVWLSGGATEGNPCNAHAHHGFNGQDAELVAKITDYARK